MLIEDKYLNESIKTQIKSVHYWVKREIDEIENTLDKIPRNYEFSSDVYQDKRMEIFKHFSDIKSCLNFLIKITKEKK